MPVVYTKGWGKGRVYYNSLGHHADVIDHGPAAEMLKRGLVWAALVKAASTGSALDGGATMLGFGAGTAGALLAIGLFATGIQRRFTRYGTRVAAVAMIAAGLFVAWRGTLSIPASGKGVPACHVPNHS